MGKTTRLKSKDAPGVIEYYAKEVIRGEKKPKMSPFTKKERI